MNTGEGLYPLRNVADLVYSNKLKQNQKNIQENLTFMLTTEEKSSRKIANPKYDPIDIEMNEMSGKTESWHTGKSQQNRESPS